MADRLDIFLDVSVLNSLNTGSDHRLIREKARIGRRFGRTKMVAQPKTVDTGKLQYLRRESKVDIHNRFAMLASIPPNDLDSRDDAITKMIHEAAILLAGRHKSEKPDKLSTRMKQLRERHIGKCRGTAYQQTTLNIPRSASKSAKDEERHL